MREFSLQYSLKSKKNFFNVSTPFFDIDNALPIKIAKKMTCNISPFTNDSKGLFGIIFNKISKMKEDQKP